jgi:hypothetical protein
MEKQSAIPEDLPALELRTVRDLEVKRSRDSERAPYVESASAVVRRGDFAYVIGDDELDLAVFTISSREPGELRAVLPGELSAATDARQRDKPDIEALSILPPFDRAPYGAILGLGSGSNAEGRRDRGFAWRLGADGSLADEPAVIDLQPLYELLRGEIDKLNVEGAAVLGDRFWLFHRGNEDGRNVVAELALAEVMESLTGDRSIEPGELRAIRSYELGVLGGTALCFSDATPLSDDEVVFTASAEDSNGEIHGSVVGTIAASGRVRRLRKIDERWKVEGVHASIDTGVIDFVFVCDQDSDEEPSPLLSATMPAAEGLEAS